MSSKVIEITNGEEYNTFKNAHHRGIIFYGADWCDACTQIHPMYTRIANRYHKHVAMAHADITVCKLDFSRIPVFVSYYKGKELDSIEGADVEGLKQLVKGIIQHEVKRRPTIVKSEVKDAEARIMDPKLGSSMEIVKEKEHDMTNETQLK